MKSIIDCISNLDWYYIVGGFLATCFLPFVFMFIVKKIKSSIKNKQDFYDKVNNLENSINGVKKKEQIERELEFLEAKRGKKYSKEEKNNFIICYGEPSIRKICEYQGKVSIVQNKMLRSINRKLNKLLKDKE